MRTPIAKGKIFALLATTRECGRKWRIVGRSSPDKVEAPSVVVVLRGATPRLPGRHGSRMLASPRLSAV